MTGPRISNTKLETLKRILGMATKPDATRTPDSKASLDDLMRQLTGGGTVSNRYEGPPLAIPISQSAMPEYIGGPGGVPKIVGKAAEFTASRIPASLKRILGIENDEALTRMTKYELEDRMYRAADDLSRAKRGYGLENPADADREIEWLDRMDPNGFQRELREDYFLAKRAGKGKGGLGFDKAHEPYLGDAPSGARMREMLDKKWLKSNTP